MVDSIFLTGGTGFLGSNIVRRALEANCNVKMLVRAESDYRQLDEIFGGPGWRNKVECVTAPTPERVPEWLASVAPKAVIHAAAKGGAIHQPTDIPSILGTNVTLGALLLEGLHSLQQKDRRARPFVFCGSFWQHADGAPPYRANTIYAASKTSFEAIAGYYRATFGMRILGVKFYDIYGPNDLRRRAIDLITDALSAPKPLAFSGGEQIIAPLAVADAADAVFHALSLLEQSNPEQLTYAAAGPERLTLRQTAALIESLAGRKPNIDWGAMPYRESQIFNPAVLPGLPGWTPRTTLREGIAMILKRRDSSDRLGGRSAPHN